MLLSSYYLLSHHIVQHFRLESGIYRAECRHIFHSHRFFRLSGVATDWLCLTTMDWLIQSTPQECRNLQN